MVGVYKKYGDQKHRKNVGKKSGIKQNLEDFSIDESIILKLIFKAYGGSYEVDFSGWTTMQ